MMNTAVNIADQVEAAARECIGTPFRHLGRIVGRGLDCIGVVIHCAQSLGADHWTSESYGRNPNGGILEAALDAQPCLEIVTDRQPGDILLMRFNTEPQHVAVYTAEDTIIHGYESVGIVCEHRLSGVWAARIVKIYRFRGVS
jgi:cell wall-associated NlpC family hydrolase